MDTVCLVFIHHYNFACIFKQKIRLKRIITIHQMKVTHLAQTTMEKNECTYFTCLISPWRQTDSFGFKSFRLRVTFNFFHDEVALISIYNSNIPSVDVNNDKCELLIKYLVYFAVKIDCHILEMTISGYLRG